MSVIEVDGAWNVRDVGGISAASGTVRTGVLFRSGNLAAVTDAGADTLRQRVGHIIDLRSDEELRAEPTPVTGVPITHLPLFFGSVRSLLESDITIEHMYEQILQEGAAKIVDALRIVAAGAPSLVHCTVGKDRTGVTIALALSAVDADREAIVADYALTESQLPVERGRTLRAYLARHHPQAVNIETLALKSPAPVMVSLLSRLDAEYGSPVDYLRANGLTAGELADLRAVLLEP